MIVQGGGIDSPDRGLGSGIVGSDSASACVQQQRSSDYCSSPFREIGKKIYDIEIEKLAVGSSSTRSS